MSPYTESDFHSDLKRVTDGRCDPELARVVVGRSEETTHWLGSAAVGVKFRLSFNRQAYEIDGRWKFWGGMVLAVEGGGKGLRDALMESVRRAGVEVRFWSGVVGLVLDEEGGVRGVKVRPGGGAEEAGEGEGEGQAGREGGEYEVYATGGVVMAAGGFEASREMRAEYLGEQWRNAYVRGTPYNTGDLLTAALGIGAKRKGHWGGCHSTCWDANAPRDAGSQELTNQYTKSGYPLGIMVNVEGKRFVDEGVDMRNYTYAKFGREILHQKGGVVFQVWDNDGASWLRGEEYAEGVVERVSAGSIEELAGKLAEKGLEGKEQFVRTVGEYNEAVAAFKKENPELGFDPSRKDGLSTRSQKGPRLELDKTNWALPLTESPFLAVKVTCGITFTFGGLEIEPETARVVAEKDGKAIPGLYCAGEMVGGLFYGNYPGGSGLTAGAVWGRIAGREAAARALAQGRENGEV